MPEIAQNEFAPDAPDASPKVQAELSDMHVDGDRTEVEQADLDAKRAEGLKIVDDRATARLEHAEAISDANAAMRDRTLAVQEEIATRERDGVVAGTPAAERRKERMKEIVGSSEVDDPALSHADRIRDIAARLHMQSPSGIEELQHELMALAAEMGGDRSEARAERDLDAKVA